MKRPADKTWRAVAAGFTFILVSVTLRADESKPVPWEGVWAGTVGTAGVQVCLEHGDYRDFGAYFYLRHLQIITLGPADKKTKPGETETWSESESHPEEGPFLRLKSVDGDHLSGTWTGSGKSLTITLTRVPLGQEDDSACGSLAFSKPRAVQPKISRKAASLDNVPYNRLIVDVGKHFGFTLESFELIGNSAAIQRVNAALRKDVPADAVGSGYLDCSMGALRSGFNGDYSDEKKPILITPNWLVSEEDNGYYCGGAHPDGESTWQNWDLRTGTLVNLWTWFLPSVAKETIEEAGTKNSYTSLFIGPPLRKKLDKTYSNKEQDCREAEATEEFWNPRLTAKGIAFTPEMPHVIAGCVEDVVIPFAQLQPLLNAAGKRGVASFLADLKTK